MTFAELAEKVLKEAKEPLTYKQIWANAEEKDKEEMKKRTTRSNYANVVEDAIYPYLKTENPKFMRVSRRPITIWLKKRERTSAIRTIATKNSRSSRKRNRRKI